ncbi:MAG: chloramphenicol acetyltransferase [Bacteroidota bacterium]
MREIIFENAHRRAHFEFFNTMNHPHFNITANVDITELLPFLKKEKLPVTPSIVYLIARAANNISEFRWRIRDGKVVEHETVTPSFSVFTEVADVFSFCTVDYEKNARRFIQRAHNKSEQMKKEPSFENEEGRDDFLFLSTIPWVSFTGFQHAMRFHPSDSVPRITWGKFFEINSKTMMPLSVQVHHAVADGRHVGKYFQLMEQMANHPAAFLNT